MKPLPLIAFVLLSTPALAGDTTLHACKALHETGNKAPFEVSGPRIEEKPALHLVGVDGGFDAESSQLGIDNLWAVFSSRDQWIEGVVAPLGYGLCYDGDDGGNFRYLAATEVDGSAPPPEGFTAKTVPAATYAVFTHQGLAWTIANARYKVHMEMLGGVELADAPEIEFYPEDYRPGSPEATMEFWIPIVAEQRAGQ
jgi:AraC family transcriptional regulator